MPFCDVRFFHFRPSLLCLYEGGKMWYTKVAGAAVMAAVCGSLDTHIGLAGCLTTWQTACIFLLRRSRTHILASFVV